MGIDLDDKHRVTLAIQFQLWAGECGECMQPFGKEDRLTAVLEGEQALSYFLE